MSRRAAHCIAYVVLAVCATRPALAQGAVSNAFRMSLQRAQRNLVAGAESMPAEKYAYKPTEQHMTFAQHMLHVAEFNDMMCALIGGGAAPAREKLAPTAAKAAIVGQLRESFASCTSSVAALDDARLGDSIKMFGGDATRAAAVLVLSGDWADHYAVTSTYLRLNGVLPPTARR